MVSNAWRSYLKLEPGYSAKIVGNNHCFLGQRLI
jgi:hypothetical protein